MLNFFQKYHSLLNLILLALFGLSCGVLVSTLLGSAMLPDPAQPPRSVPVAAPQALGTTNSDLNLILQRNIFDPSGRSAETFDPGGETGDQTAETAPPRHNFELLGTAVADEKSLALLSIDNEPATYRLDELLPGGGQLEEIRRNLVRIRNPDQTVTTLQILEDKATPQPSPRRRDEEATEATGNDVRQIGKNRWLIASETAEKSRQNLAQELRLAQMQPRIVDGQTDGFFIRSINPRSLLNKLGLRRGDIILSVNGMALDSPEKALQIFQQLREARRIDVALERRGEAMNFAYELD